MHQVGTFETIYRYPVKSMAGEELGLSGQFPSGVFYSFRFTIKSAHA
jgi:hypothetical protein